MPKDKKKYDQYMEFLKAKDLYDFWNANLGRCKKFFNKNLSRRKELPWKDHNEFI